MALLRQKNVQAKNFLDETAEEKNRHISTYVAAGCNFCFKNISFLIV